jgi:arabinogalactan oligomer/maltooligosaccharide transport system permease protein
MVSWSGRRKFITILLFLLPTLIGLIIFNVFPIFINTYMSFTDRNKFHPKPDCTVKTIDALDPLCWDVFEGTRGTGLGQPYTIQEPVFANYQRIFGSLFTKEAVVSLGILAAIILIPLIFARQINKTLDRRMTRSISPFLVWATAIALIVALGLIFRFDEQLATLMDTGDFIVVVFRTIFFVAVRVPLSFMVGLLLALILNSEHLPGKTFFRVALFVPWAASSVAILVALIWQFVFREQGVINQLLWTLFSIDGPSWLNNNATAMGAVLVADIWFSYPFFMVAILGALQSIPQELYEAANVDGANWWNQLMNITMPLIRPAVLPAAVLTSITAFQMFGTAFAITTGGPFVGAADPGATELVMLYAYRQIFQLQNYGLATAFAVIIFLMLFIMTLFSMRVTRLTKSQV